MKPPDDRGGQRRVCLHADLEDELGALARTVQRQSRRWFRRWRRGGARQEHRWSGQGGNIRADRPLISDSEAYGQPGNDMRTEPRLVRVAARDTGNTSNARLATVKVMEESREGLRPATGKSGGQHALEAIQSVPTPVHRELHRAWLARQLQRMLRFLPIG